MKAGPLDQRVTIERLSGAVDELNQPIPDDWVFVATVWAAIEPLNGREYFAAQTALAEVTTRIRVRYRPGLSPVDRVNHDGKLHNITAIINPRSGDRELVLMCRAWG